MRRRMRRVRWLRGLHAREEPRVVIGHRDDIKRRVHEATDIVRLVEEHVVLRPRGREFVGLCPFHDDKNPSMCVVPHKQIFHCFVCGTGGDAFTFAMKYHKLTFPEALAMLAERANIALPKFAAEAGEGEGPSPRQRVLQVNTHAMGFYRKMLADPAAGTLARQYVEQRSISVEMAELFQIGLAPDDWDALSRHAVSKGWDIGAMVQAGLIAARDRGEGHYDKFRHRLIFPILDAMGRPIAFGGRVLAGSKREDASDAKYLNSPESPVFNKSSTLYGIHAAQKPILAARTAIIVEGYTDVIACHQAGVRNVVATLGTALTAEHARILRRYCDRVVLVFDGDEAGQRAADRAVGVFFAETLDVAVAVIPGGLDPADLLLTDGGRGKWDEAIGAARDALAFQFDRVRERFGEADSTTARQRIVDEFLGSLVQLGIGRLERQRYGLIFAQVAQLLGLSPGVVEDQLRKKMGTRPRSASAPLSEPEPATQHSRAERQMVGALLSATGCFEATLSDGRPLGESIVPNDLTDAGVRAVFQGLSDWLHENETLEGPDFRSAFPDESTLELALALQLEADRLADSKIGHLTEMVLQNARAILRDRAENEYQQRKLEMRGQGANDAAPDEGMSRLSGDVQHLKNNPTARRVPRVVGQN